MPPLDIRDIGTLVAVVVAVAGVAVGLFRTMVRRDEDGRRYGQQENIQTQARIDGVKESTRLEFSRVDREISELRERLAALPSRGEVEAMFARTDQKLDAIILNFGGASTTPPTVRRGKNQWSGD